MIFACPKCSKSGQIDDSKVPEDGVYAICPECKSRFIIKQEKPKGFEFEPIKKQDHIKSIITPNIDIKADPVNKIEYYKAAIGTNFDKYADVVNRHEKNENPSSWCWPALFFGCAWALYRKMYVVSFLYLVVLIVLELLMNVSGVFGVILILLSAMFAVSAKSIYVKHISSKIVSCGNLSYENKINKLVTECGTNAWVPYFAIIPLIGIIAAIAIPQFSNYRSKTTLSTSPQSKLNNLINKNKIRYSSSSLTFSIDNEPFTLSSRYSKFALKLTAVPSLLDIGDETMAEYDGLRVIYKKSNDNISSYRITNINSVNFDMANDSSMSDVIQKMGPNYTEIYSLRMAMDNPNKDNYREIYYQYGGGFVQSFEFKNDMLFMILLANQDAFEQELKFQPMIKEALGI